MEASSVYGSAPTPVYAISPGGPVRPTEPNQAATAARDATQEKTESCCSAFFSACCNFFSWLGEPTGNLIAEGEPNFLGQRRVREETNGDQLLNCLACLCRCIELLSADREKRD